MKKVSLFCMALLMTALLVYAKPAQAQSIDESLEYVTTGFGDNQNIYWTVQWSIPYIAVDPAMDTYCVGLGKFKMPNGSFVRVNDRTIKEYSSGMNTGNVNFSWSANIPAMFLPDMPSGATHLYWKVSWNSVISWGTEPNRAFLNDYYTEEDWHVYTL